MYRRSIFAGILVLTQTACQLGEKKDSTAKDLTYSFTENDCSTGKVRYTSDADYCAALRDDARNNNCARAMRQKAFTNRPCPGEFSSSEGGRSTSTTSTTLPINNGSSTTTTTRPGVESSTIEIRAQLVGGLWNRETGGGRISLHGELLNVTTDQSSQALTDDYRIGNARVKSILIPGPGTCVPASILGTITRTGSQTGSALHIHLPTSVACDQLALQLDIASEVRIRFEDVPTFSGRTVSRVTVRVGPGVPRP